MSTKNVETMAYFLRNIRRVIDSRETNYKLIRNSSVRPIFQQRFHHDIYDNVHQCENIRYMRLIYWPIINGDSFSRYHSYTRKKPENGHLSLFHGAIRIPIHQRTIFHFSMYGTMFRILPIKSQHRKWMWCESVLKARAQT